MRSKMIKIGRSGYAHSTLLTSQPRAAHGGAERSTRSLDDTDDDAAVDVSDDDTESAIRTLEFNALISPVIYCTQTIARFAGKI